MEHFLASQIDITYVLSLYPSIILPKTTLIPEPEKLMDISLDASYLSRASSGLSDDMEISPLPQLLESDENAALESKKMSHNTLMALIKFLQKKRYSVIEKATAEGTEEVVLDVVGDNFASFDSSRFKKSTKSKSNQSIAELTQKFKPESIIEYLKPLCGTDPMLVLECSMLVLESCPTQTIELYLSGNIPADLVNSYLKQHAPNMQAKYLELMLAMNENGISGNLQNEMVQIYLSEVLEWYADLSAQEQWDEKAYSSTRKKLLSALESISGYNPEALLKRLPPEALYEERALLLGKMNQHELALSLYVHKLHVPELALAYCDRVYEPVVHQPSVKSSGNIYLTLLQIYLNPRRTTKNFEKRITNIVSPLNTSIPKVVPGTSVKAKVGRGNKKIASIEGAEDMRVSQSSTDSSRSDGDVDESTEEGGSAIMLDEILDLLSRRWDRLNGAQALKLLPRETKLQNLLPFLGPLLRKSSEAYRNLSVIKSLRQSENLQVKDELYNQRKTVVKITGDSLCSLCNKKIGTSVFAVYPNGKTLVHFVCFRDSQSMKAVAKGSPLRRR
ncbi:vacuolar sorting protein 39 [Quercus suber]